MMDWAARLGAYGPWALVIGASEGIGRAFAERIAEAQINVVLVARRLAPLDELSQSLSARHGVEAMAVPVDFSDANAAARIAEITEELDIGLVVYNAAYSLIGPFLSHSAADHVNEVVVNCIGPVNIAHHFGERFQSRERSALVLMSSMAGYQGSPWISNYAATKAYNRILGQGLWDEFSEIGADVVVCNAGATETPAYRRSAPDSASGWQPAVQDPETVADAALLGLGRAPVVVPGWANRIAAGIMSRLMPTRTAIRIMSRNLKAMYRNRSD